MAKGKYYTPEFKEQAVKMVVGLDCTLRSAPHLIGPVLPAGRPSRPVAISMAAPRTGARYDRGRIEAVPHRARRRTGLPHAHVPPRPRGRPARPTSGAAADQ